MYDLTIDELEQQLRTTAPEDVRARVDLLNHLAYQVRELEQWDRMTALVAESRPLAESIGYNIGVAQSLVLEAFVRYIRSDLRPGLELCMRALELAEGDADTEAKTLTVLAMLHWTLGNYEEGLRHVDRALWLLESRVDDEVTEGFAHNVRGGILHTLQNHEEALLAHQRSHAIFKRLDHSLGLSRSLSGLGSAYKELGNLPKAIDCQLQSLEVAGRANHGIGVSRALSDLGEIHFVTGDDTKALTFHLEALRLRRRDGYQQAATTSLLNLGLVYKRRNDPETALAHLREGLGIAKEIGARPKEVQFHKVLSELYEETGEFGKALEHLKAYENFRAEIFRDQAKIRVEALELQVQLESARKDAEIHRLRNFELKDKNEELALLLEQLQATQAELIHGEKMAALGSLVAALVHEINSPLGVIRSASDLTLRCANKLAKAQSPDGGTLGILRENAGLLASASVRIQTLVDRLKHFAGLDCAEYTQLDLRRAIDDTVALLEPEFRGRVEVPREFGPVPSIYCYAAELLQVFMHLLRNAIEAIDGRGVVLVRTEADAEHVRVVFRDSGRGIPPEQLSRLFNPGFSSRDRRVKASLSLFTCFDIVRKHGGDILVESIVGKGSTFSVVLPRELETRAELSQPSSAVQAIH